MVRRQLSGRGITDEHVLRAMGAVPREAFVPEELAGRAYEDSPLPIGEGQTISQPFVVAAMVAAAGVRPGDRVLEVGAGSGYAAAVLHAITDEVYAIERQEGLGNAAIERLAALGYDGVRLRIGDGTTGWPEAAPFDAILVAAGAPVVPPALVDQLAVGGRLVIPVGPRTDQSLRVVTRTDPDTVEERDAFPVRFVPLIGTQGWPD